MPFYPAWLYKNPGTPLHFLQQLRDFYIAEYDDPIVQDDKGPHYMGILFVLEVAMQLPVALYAVYRLGVGRRTTGTFELALLVYALETALSTVLVLHFVYMLDPAEYPQKNVLLFQNYVPWLISRESAATKTSSDWFSMPVANADLHYSRSHVCRHVLQTLQAPVDNRYCQEKAVVLHNGRGFTGTPG